MNSQNPIYPKVEQLSFVNLCVNAFIFFGLMCFSISHFLPVFFTSAEDIYGFWVLITGWMGLVFLQPAWYANLLTLLALLLINERPRTAFLLSLLAISVASCSFIFYEIPIGINYEKVFIREFGLGFYLWYISHILISTGLSITFIRSLRK